MVVYHVDILDRSTQIQKRLFCFSIVKTDYAINTARLLNVLIRVDGIKSAFSAR